MPLQAGTWTLNINGSMNEFTIAVGSAGNVSGTLGLATPLIVNGFWDETAQKITMISALVGGGQAVQIYVGYLMLRRRLRHNIDGAFEARPCVWL
jgi:hypothetical protein